MTAAQIEATQYVLGHSWTCRRWQKHTSWLVRDAVEFLPEMPPPGWGPVVIELSGINAAQQVDIDPRPLTLRQLLWMADGRNENHWLIASAVMALLANCHRDSKKRAFTPDDFNPMVHRTQRADVLEVNRDTVGLMREAFLNQHDLGRSASASTSQ